MKIFELIKRLEEQRTNYNIEPEEGRFLNFLVKRTKSKNILEIGTANAYSSLWLAEAVMRNKGIITTIEPNKESVKSARENIKKAGLEKTIRVIEGDALIVIPKLEKRFDFVFIDAIKKDYLKYLKLIEPKLKDKAIIAAHNVISHKEKMLDYLSYVRKNFKCVLVPIGDGIELSKK